MEMDIPFEVLFVFPFAKTTSDKENNKKIWNHIYHFGSLNKDFAFISWGRTASKRRRKRWKVEDTATWIFPRAVLWNVFESNQSRDLFKARKLGNVARKMNEKYL